MVYKSSFLNTHVFLINITLINIQLHMYFISILLEAQVACLPYGIVPEYN